jgi:hypothetical protein
MVLIRSWLGHAAWASLSHATPHVNATRCKSVVSVFIDYGRAFSRGRYNTRFSQSPAG